jgi:hypothetical protein
MSELFASGRIVDLILVLMAAEALLAVALRRRLGGARRLTDLLVYLASGACLLLGLRIALVEGWWGWIGTCLAAAFAIHLLELRRRWQSASHTPGNTREAGSAWPARTLSD